ncbi:MAG: hypothetical protein GY896_21935 [Gammaproteobacteria bacterium]|nr:hypothetical protein [Gammaproteobacteria bacterium]
MSEPSLQKSISPDNPQRVERIERKIAAVLDSPGFEKLSMASKDRLVRLVGKRLRRAKRLDGNLITADLLLLRHRNPELFRSDLP